MEGLHPLVLLSQFPSPKNIFLFGAPLQADKEYTIPSLRSVAFYAPDGGIAEVSESDYQQATIFSDRSDTAQQYEEIHLYGFTV